MLFLGFLEGGRMGVQSCDINISYNLDWKDHKTW